MRWQILLCPRFLRYREVSVVRTSVSTSNLIIDRYLRTAHTYQPMIAFYACTFHQRWQPILARAYTSLNSAHSSLDESCAWRVRAYTFSLFCVIDGSQSKESRCLKQWTLNQLVDFSIWVWQAEMDVAVSPFSQHLFASGIVVIDKLLE